MDEYQYTKDETQTRKSEWVYSAPLYLVLPIQWIVVGFLVYKTSTLSIDSLGFEWLGLVFTVGICCGTFGINVAHELGHQKCNDTRSLPHEDCCFHHSICTLLSNTTVVTTVMLQPIWTQPLLDTIKMSMRFGFNLYLDLGVLGT